MNKLLVFALSPPAALESPASAAGRETAKMQMLRSMILRYMVFPCCRDCRERRGLNQANTVSVRGFRIVSCQFDAAAPTTTSAIANPTMRSVAAFSS